MNGDDSLQHILNVLQVDDFEAISMFSDDEVYRVGDLSHEKKKRLAQAGVSVTPWRSGFLVSKTLGDQEQGDGGI